MTGFRFAAPLSAVLAAFSTAPALPAEGAVAAAAGTRTAAVAPEVSAKLDPALRRLVSTDRSLSALSASTAGGPRDVRIEVTDEGNVLVPCLIRSKDPAETARRVVALGGTHRVTSGEIVVAVVRREELASIAAGPEVVSASASYLRKPLLDASRPATGADQIQAGVGLPSAYTGKGVIVGLVDSGIDLRHPDFSADKGTRILAVWDVSGLAAGAAPRVCTASQIAGGTCTEIDVDGHGTHAAGIAAGNGTVRPEYRGMAPEANLVVARAGRSTSVTGFYDDDIVDACSFIFGQAKALGRPAVINVSAGSVRGPLDGTSELETALSALTGPGRIIVAAAGNAGNTPVHLSYAAKGNSPDTSNETEIFIDDPSQPAEIELWYRAGSLSAGFTLYTTREDPSSTPPVGPGAAPGVQPLLTQGGVHVADYEVDASTTSSPTNGDHVVKLSIQPTLGGIRFGVRFALYVFGSGTMDAWITNGRFGTVSEGYWRPGDSKKTVASPATAKGVIAAGAYTTKIQWIDYDWVTQRKTDCGLFGDLACFNSTGPTRDGRSKPDITAPGQVVVAPMSLWASPAQPRTRTSPDEKYLVLEGTSMAAAHVTGLVALMLQANPALDFDAVSSALRSTASADAFTGAAPDPNVWGAGKLNGYAAVKAVAGSVPVPDFTLQISPSSLAVLRGATATATVGCTAVGGFASPVALSASGAPAGASVAFSRPSIECGRTTASLTVSSGAAAAGSYTLAISGNGSGLTRSTSVGLTVLGPAGGESTLFVPVVLKTAGASGSFYTSELTFTNRSGRDATLRLRYTAAAGGGSGTGTASLAAGRQLIVNDGIAFLRDLGVPIPADGNRYGTLLVTFEGVSSAADVSVLVRTTTPVPTAAPTGAAGLAYAGVPVAKLPTGPVVLCGLRRDALDRTNIAVQNAGGDTASSVGVRVTLFSGASPAGAIVSTENVVLGPGEFRQFEAPEGFFGWARVERTSGAEPWYAYAVINDNVNSDGSFVLPIAESTLGGASGLTLPVALETGVYGTEGILANLTDQSRRVRLDFYADALGPAPPTWNVDLPARSQVSFPSLVEAMRKGGISVPTNVVGPVFVTAASGSTQGLFVGARTGSPGGGGRYSLSYAAVPFGAASTTTAIVSGLQQTATSRSNLALVNTGEVDGSTSTFRIELFDGGTGAKAGEKTVTVGPRRAFQENAILSTTAPGTTNAWVRVTKTNGNNPFVAYGVINDGAAPGQRSGDGAFILSE